jgi:phosphinothricin acetyltransferase
VPAAARVRPAEREDLAAILAIYNHYVRHTAATFEIVPPGVEERGEWFARHDQTGRHRLLVAEEDAPGVVGWASTSEFRPRAAYATTVESSVYCHPEAQRRGLGTCLYRELFLAIEHEDVERIVAGVTLPNPASVALHVRFGFVPVGTFHRVGRKFERYWDVEWFERPLRLPPPVSTEGRAR